MLGIVNGLMISVMLGRAFLIDTQLLFPFVDFHKLYVAENIRWDLENLRGINITALKSQRVEYVNPENKVRVAGFWTCSLKCQKSLKALYLCAIVCMYAHIFKAIHIQCTSQRSQNNSQTKLFSCTTQGMKRRRLFNIHLHNIFKADVAYFACNRGLIRLISRKPWGRRWFEKYGVNPSHMFSCMFNYAFRLHNTIQERVVGRVANSSVHFDFYLIIFAVAS